jgi:DNA transformation protein
MKKGDSFRDYVLDQLRDAGKVESRAMFGGYGLYRDGRIFGIVYKGRFYLKTGPKGPPGWKPFKPNVRQRLNSYHEVPADLLENAADLARWVARAPSGEPTGKERR